MAGTGKAAAPIASRQPAQEAKPAAKGPAPAGASPQPGPLYWDFVFRSVKAVASGAENPGGDARHPAVQSALGRTGQGRPLPGDIRRPMEARFRVGLDRVRIHTDGADSAAEALQARAFTSGEDIFFARDAFSPSDSRGLGLLAHELTHVVQGYEGKVPVASPGGEVSRPSDPLEREAERIGALVEAGSAAPSAGVAPTVQRPPAASPVIHRYVDPDGHTLPDPIALTIGGDKMRLEFKRIQKQGEPAFECAVKYMGPLPTDGPSIQDNTQHLSTTIGTATLKSVVLKQGPASVDVDLFGDGTRVIRVEDEVTFDDRPMKKGRAHRLQMKVNGKSVFAASLWVLDPSAKASDIQPTTPEESPGENPRVFYIPSTGTWDFTIDGDGDQYKELLVRLEDRTPSASMGTTTATKVRVQITQLSTKTALEKEFDLPAPTDKSPLPTLAVGALFPVLKQVTDGGSPTIVELTTTLGSAPPTMKIHPPERTPSGVRYEVGVPGLNIFFPFPPEKAPIHEVFDPGKASVIGNIVFADIALGAYKDRFRLTLQPRTADKAVLGLSPLYRDQPVGGSGVEISFAKPIVYLHKRGNETSLTLDLDNDGTPELTLFDRLTTPDTVDGGGPPESNRNHEVRIVGAPVGGEKTLWFRFRDGFPMRAGGAAQTDVDVTSNALAVGELGSQAAEGSFTAQLDAYENAMTAERKKAVTAGVLTQATFDAWLELSQSIIRLRPQKLPVDVALQAQAALQADALFKALASETSGTSTTVAGHGWWVSTNPYTGEVRSPAGSSGAGPSLAGHLRAGRWGSAFSAYETLVAGLDHWIVDGLKAKGQSSAQASRVELIAGRKRELAAIESKNPRRVLATFQPDDKFKKEQGYVSQIPLALYYWKEDDTWVLRNITNPAKAYHVKVDAAPGETAPPRALLQKLDDPDRLPAGRIHYDVPGHHGGEVRTTDGLTWGKFFSYLGLALAAVGLGLATFGTGTVAVAGAWVLAGSAVVGAVSAGIDLADKAKHGDLDATTAVLDIAQIVAGLAGATALASSRIALAASNAPASARWAGNWARLAVLANKVYIPATATAVTADVMSFAVISVETAKQLEDIEARQGDDPSSKARAKMLLISQVAALAGLNALSIKGTVANLSRGRTLVLTPGPDGVPVATLALDKTSVVIDTNAAIALDRRARGLPLDSGHEAAIKRVEKLGADLRVVDSTLAEMGVKGGNPTQKGVPVSVERTSKEYQDLLTNLSNPADPVGQAKGGVDRTIVADTFFAITEPGVKPALATADKKVYNALSRRAGYDPNAKGAGIAVPEKFPDGFDVTINGRTIKVIPIR